MQIAHATQATGVNDPSKQISKNAWNQGHLLTLSSGVLVGRSTADEGAAEELSGQAVRTIAGLEWIGAYAWANRPAAVSNSGKSITVTDIGGTAGSIWRSDGTRWKPQAGSVVLGTSAVAVSCGADTNETILGSVTIPAGAMGPNGRLRIQGQWVWTTSGNAKTWRVRLGGIGGTMYIAIARTATTGERFETYLQNTGAVNAQVGGPSNMGADGTTAAAVVTSSTDTDAADTTLVLTGTKASAGETLTLQSYLVELLVP